MRFTLLILLSFQYVLAQAPKKFKPHMLIHEHLGCPQNSSCTKTMGTKYKKWTDSLTIRNTSSIERFTKNFGTPLRTWTRSANDTQVITYDSPCKNHRLKDSPIYEVITLHKNKMNKGLIYNKAFAEDGRTFLIPVKSIPSGIKNNSIHFLKEVNGTFYNLFLGPQGIGVNYNILADKEVLETKCPKALVSKFDQWIKPKNLFLGNYCKKVWDFDKNKYLTLLFGWSC